MRIKSKTLRCPLAAALLLSCSLRQAPGQGGDAEWRRMLQASDTEQADWIRSHLDRGMPAVDPDASVLTMLVLNKSSVALPLIEQKIEQVLRSPSPLTCFRDKSVDPPKFVALAAATIAYAGDDEALREVSRLIRIDQQRFGALVESTLVHARTRRNPFTVAYHGLEIGDPAVDSRIAAWAEVELSEKRPPLRSRGPRAPEPVPEFEINRVRAWWAEALADKYGGKPSDLQWAADPIASRLKPGQAEALHDDMMRRTREIAAKRQKPQ